MREPRRQSTINDYLTTNEVADHFGIAAKAVLRMIRQDRLAATKRGWVWLVHREDLPAKWPPPLS